MILVFQVLQIEAACKLSAMAGHNRFNRFFNKIQAIEFITIPVTNNMFSPCSYSTENPFINLFLCEVKYKA